MLPVLEGKLPLVVHAVREQAIRDAIAFAEKEKLKIVISRRPTPGRSRLSSRPRTSP